MTAALDDDSATVPRPAAGGGRPARSAVSLAWAGLANSCHWIDSAKGVAGVYATQIPSFFDEKTVQAFQAFETEAYLAITIPPLREPSLMARIDSGGR